ncbi:MAG: hypothetical protein JJE16_05985 [Nitrospiraceae bacterium]|nr:hypothetical protein [Nitrospiraceae bacterium]
MRRERTGSRPIPTRWGQNAPPTHGVVHLLHRERDAVTVCVVRQVAERLLHQQVPSSVSPSHVPRRVMRPEGCPRPAPTRERWWSRAGARRTVKA